MKNSFEDSSFLFSQNISFIEKLYSQYKTDPDKLDPEWQSFFNAYKEDSLPTKVQFKHKTNFTNVESKGPNAELLDCKAQKLIQAYRRRGHLCASLDPLKILTVFSKQAATLTYSNLGIKDEEIKQNFSTKILDSNNLDQLNSRLDKIYCKNLGIEFDHIENDKEKKWLYERIENNYFYQSYSKEEKIDFLKQLIKTESFEAFLQLKFPGEKRFSIEGGETSVLALLHTLKLAVCNNNVNDIVIGMAHRGRLATLFQVLDKPFCEIIAELLGKPSIPTELGASGDVKYHMGYDNVIDIDGKEIKVSMLPNPSHLEAVYPVVLGSVRAKQDFFKDKKREQVLGIVIHGDAAFSGQGVVMESITMSTLPAYYTGGIIHFIVNNQLGFTATPKETYAGRYTTEVAKIAKIPILHVNGDDAEAVLNACKLAVDYRKNFQKDILIDILCYRRRGHNEGDEPMFTQGPMYHIIKNKQLVSQVYFENLLSDKVLEEVDYDKFKNQLKLSFDNEFSKAKDYEPEYSYLTDLWKGMIRPAKVAEIVNPATGVDKSLLIKLADAVFTIPKDFSIHPRIAKLFEDRKKMVESDHPIDWAVAEQLAFASILAQNIPIRLTGQDSERGTFSHRHAVLHSQTDMEKYVPLNHLSKSQAFYEIANSHLSEYAVLGFEYGYSTVQPNQLVIWEAQFGDFSNGAQIIFDQFISSSETKWLRMSGIVMLLPHGYEGQGPEHSSARLERYLQAAAEFNIEVVYPTTPASYFHLLRRQVSRNFRRPLIVMSPKSLLRNKLTISHLSEITDGTSFVPVLMSANSKQDTSLVKRIILCGGKVFYDLLQAQEKNKIENIPICRLEQYYPFPEKELLQAIENYSEIDEIVWCQEEPRNMGAWEFVRPYLNIVINKITKNKKISLHYIGRAESASPAVGYSKIHTNDQENLLKQALNIGV